MAFESKLQNMVAELDAEKQAFEQEEWAKINNSTLDDYRREQETVCNEGIAALQRQRDAAIAAKKDELYREMKAKSDAKFSEARQKLEETLAMFSDSTVGG
ncbi:MAG: hypothetical protein K2N23_00435 [Clostridia bacterium]|nr:hypothetical protein [Clostridia bacterium]